MVIQTEYERQRHEMVERQIRARGVCSPRVLDAMGKVRREGYVPSYLGEFAYEDAALPIEEEQTISQPYIVAYMIDSLGLKGGEKVLEIGTGSGYAAAVLAEVAGEVYTIERHGRLARTARERLARDGYTNVHVRCGDGTLGWEDEAPFDAIIVAAGGPVVPDALRRQLRVGGRMVIPVGTTVGLQKLKRVWRVDALRFGEESLVDVRFVPLVGTEGWHEEAPVRAPQRIDERTVRPPVVKRLRRAVEPFATIDDCDLEPLLRRIGEARVVLLGESTHGTSEFYRMRAAITRALVERGDFGIVAVEADWPDAARIDHHVRDRDAPPAEWQAFARFPTWMWRNRETRAFVEWLRGHNAGRPLGERARFAGLDLYALHHSIAAVLAYLDDADPSTARIARERYGCLTPWQKDPAAYGRAALTGTYRTCEHEVVRMLGDLLDERLKAWRRHDEGLFEAVQNARAVADAEAYYRIMYYGSHESWNLRDRHMFLTLRSLLDFHGERSRAVVWAHNSHLGDASATDMATRGELNLGQLCRRHFGTHCYAIGFGTDHGTVAAASHWDGPMELKRVRPSHARSYERLFHETEVPRFLLPLQGALREDVHEDLMPPRLQRAIGVVYRPETELASHYLHAVLPRQFDEYVWFDESEAVRALHEHETAGLPDDDPFGT